MGEKKLSEQIEKLERRLDDLEERLFSGSCAGEAADGDQQALYCAVPQVPPREFGRDVSEERQEAILSLETKWVNGTVLRYYLFPGGPFAASQAERQTMQRAFDIWKDVGIGLEFKETHSIDEAEVKIGFLNGDGSWSYVGRQVLNRGRNERTMNIGWDITRGNGIDTAVHEIGHTLGLNHEHQNPNSGIVWNEQAVYAAFAAEPNRWPPEKTHYNILRKIPRSEVDGSTWDPDSIMHYAFGRGLINQPIQYRSGLSPAPGLSETDKATIRRFYPGEPPARELRPFQARTLELGPGEQADFTVIPEASRFYTFSTFGESDTVCVLFENDDGQWRHIKGDDDSGTDRNARIREWLHAGRQYMLRIRLYSEFGSGETAVMMW